MEKKFGNKIIFFQMAVAEQQLKNLEEKFRIYRSLKCGFQMKIVKMYYDIAKSGRNVRITCYKENKIIYYNISAEIWYFPISMKFEARTFSPEWRITKFPHVYRILFFVTTVMGISYSIVRIDSQAKNKRVYKIFLNSIVLQKNFYLFIYKY